MCVSELFLILCAHNTDSHSGLVMMKHWIDRQEKTFAEYETLPEKDRNDVSLDQLKGHAYIDKARVLQGLGKDAEAVEAYQKKAGFAELAQRFARVAQLLSWFAVPLHQQQR